MEVSPKNRSFPGFQNKEFGPIFDQQTHGGVASKSNLDIPLALLESICFLLCRDLFKSALKLPVCELGGTANEPTVVTVAAAQRDSLCRIEPYKDWML